MCQGCGYEVRYVKVYYSKRLLFTSLASTVTLLSGELETDALFLLEGVPCESGVQTNIRAVGS